MKKYEFVFHANKPYTARDIAKSVVDMLNDGEYSDLDVAIFETVDAELAYCYKQWEIMMDYCVPEMADLHYATKELFDDIYACIKEVEEER